MPAQLMMPVGRERMQARRGGQRRQGGKRDHGVWVFLFKAATVCQLTAYQCVQKLNNVLYGTGKQFEVAVSINHD